MSDVLAHYDRPALAQTIDDLLSGMLAGGDPVSPQQLAPLDQFHTRGIAATAELANLAGIDRSMHVLDAGSGLGGPARFLAATYGCRVTGLDLSPSFVETARTLTRRARLEDQVSFEVGDVTQLPYEDDAFDRVMLFHVAMNVADRAMLYGGIRRVLRPGGRFVSYDVTRARGDEPYPLPWAPQASSSFLLTNGETHVALERAGLNVVSWTDQTALAATWFAGQASAPPSPNAPSLARLIGPEFPTMMANFARSLAERRLNVVAVMAE